MKKNKALLTAVTMTGILFCVLSNLAFSSYALQIKSAKERFPYDGITREPVSQNEHNIIKAHANIKETYRIATPTAHTTEKNAKVAFVFSNKWKAYATAEDLAKLIADKDSHYDDIFFINYRLLSIYGIFPKGEISFTDFVTIHLFPLYIIIGILIVFVAMLKNIYTIWALDNITALAMYKSIGASKKHIRHILIKEALRQSVPAVVISLVAGNAVSWAIIASVKKIIGAAYITGSEASYHFSMTLNMANAGFIFLCIILAVRIPARRLARLNIIEVLKGNYELKSTRKKKRAKDFKTELRKNNFTAFKASSNLLLISLVLSFFLLMMMAGIDIEHKYWDYERPYDIHLLLRTKRDVFVNGVPSVFKAIATNLKKDRYLIYTQKNASVNIVPCLSSAFKEKGFYKKAQGKLVTLKEGKALVNVFLIGLLPDDFKKLSGHTDYRGLILLNSVRSNLEDILSEAKYIHYLDERTKSIPVRIENRGTVITKDFPIENYVYDIDFLLYDRHINSFDYDITAFLPAEELLRIVQQEVPPRDKREDNFSLFSMNIKDDTILSEDKYIEMLKNFVEENERFIVRSEKRRKTKDELNDRFLLFFFYIVCSVVVLITLATMYSAISMLFKQRRREIFLLKSCGITERELETLFFNEYLFLLIKPLVIAIPLCTALVFWYTSLSLSFTVKRFLFSMNYAFMAGIIATFAVFVYLFFKTAAQKLKGMNIAEEIR